MGYSPQGRKESDMSWPLIYFASTEKSNFIVGFLGLCVSINITA